MLNDPSNEAGAKNPDAQIKINGNPAMWTSLEIEATNSYRASTFNIQMPTQNQPNFKFDELVDTEELKVEINIDDGHGTLTRVLVGDVDYLDWDWRTQSATFSGRDYTAKFIDETITDKYPASTSSRIIELLVDKHGLKKDITETSTPVGSYYNGQYAKMIATTSEWDLMMFLAQKENFDLYVENDTVVFKPKTEAKSYYILECSSVSESVSTANVIQIRFHRNYTIANDLAVTVHGYDLYTQKKYAQTVRRHHVPSRGTKKQKYIASVSGVTQEQAAQTAQHVALELSLHEKTFSAELAGDLILTPRSVIKLSGYSPRLDQLYYPVSIIRRISFDGGFGMTVDAKNHDPNTQVDLL